MNFRNIFTLTLSALVISILTFSCTYDSNIAEVKIAPEIPLLKEKLPEVHDLIDFTSYKSYSYETNGQTIEMESFAAKENDVIVGYYMESDEQTFYTAITETHMIQTNLLNDNQLIVDRVYDEKKGRISVDLESVFTPVEAFDLNEVQGAGPAGPGGVDPCVDFCMTGYFICLSLCEGLEISIDLISPDEIDILIIIGGGVCATACRVAATVCLLNC